MEEELHNTSTRWRRNASPISFLQPVSSLRISDRPQICLAQPLYTQTRTHGASTHNPSHFSVLLNKKEG